MPVDSSSRTTGPVVQRSAHRQRHQPNVCGQDGGIGDREHRDPSNGKLGDNLSTGGTSSIDIYGMWLHRGAVAATAPAPWNSPLRIPGKGWSTANQGLLVRNVGASNFRCISRCPMVSHGFGGFLRNLQQTIGPILALICARTNAGTGAYGVITFDIGYSIYYTPSGASGETCGNHHLNDNFTAVNFYDSAGNTVDPGGRRRVCSQ